MYIYIPKTAAGVATQAVTVTIININIAVDLKRSKWEDYYND
jgi:hypothetical protein